MDTLLVARRRVMVYCGVRVSNSGILCLILFLVAGCYECTNEEAASKKGESRNQAKDKVKITRLDELPQHAYPISIKVSQLVVSNERIKDLAAKVQADVEADLAAFKIDDPTTLRGMYNTLRTIELLNGRYDKALVLMKKERALEDKEGKKLTLGLESRALIAAKNRVALKEDAAGFKKAFRSQLKILVKDLPWDVVQDSIKESKGRLEVYSENLLIGIVQAQMDPQVKKTGELDADMARSIISMHYTMKERLPLKDEVIGVYQEWINSNKKIKPDIWTARAVSLSENSGHSPVLMAVWDSGTDEDIFKDQLFVNPNETIDGVDEDNNGFVDDVHGIAYDIHAKKTQKLIYPLGESADRINQVMAHMKGFTDIQSALDSPEASSLKKHLASLSPEKVKGFIEDLSLAGNYCHGSHVAGLMLDGNPFGRLLIARLSYDYRIPPVLRDEEWGMRDAKKCQDTIEYFKAQDVRVVNMSWGEAQNDVESSLEQNGVGENAEERRVIARKVFKLQKDGLYNAIKNAPEILFVCAAGNSDNDVGFDQFIPSSFNLPNLLVVGAVDQAGDPTSFTSFGKTVQVYSNGFEVESYVPGGKLMKMSGTSMASPNVANLAGKILAVNPRLTPQNVIDLIKKGADSKKEGSVSFLLMNPKKSIELVKAD